MVFPHTAFPSELIWKDKCSSTSEMRGAAHPQLLWPVKKSSASSPDPRRGTTGFNSQNSQQGQSHWDPERKPNFSDRHSNALPAGKVFADTAQSKYLTQSSTKPTEKWCIKLSVWLWGGDQCHSIPKLFLAWVQSNCWSVLSLRSRKLSQPTPADAYSVLYGIFHYLH